jgi:hypothetical protein
MQGAFYTDFRLAQFVGEQVALGLNGAGVMVDLASGSGILLVATVLAASHGDRLIANDLVANTVCAADRDAGALRACRTSLAALCCDLDAIVEVHRRLRCEDSLLVGRVGWADIAPRGFNVVVGNPPWEKVKLSTHEFLIGSGQERHYGSEYRTESIDMFALAGERAQRATYAASVGHRFPIAANGELDLYKAFLACSLEVLAADGQCCLVVPAGLIRSQGSEPLRRRLLDECGAIQITVVDNRARFFAIDSRFKFLVVHAEKSNTLAPLKLRHAVGSSNDVRTTPHATIDRSTLVKIRPDLTIPEVHSDPEWRAVVEMHERGVFFDSPRSPFQATIVREVDMSRDRARFSTTPQVDHLPLVEGRMIAQHRFGAKAYRSGTGRRALWDTRASGTSTIKPQFYFPVVALPGPVVNRTNSHRIGFCDVTGQTNERSIIAARVPSGVVCGNKVPTITFQNDDKGQLSWLFLAIANSLAFDWLARRVLTTSVNYFVLRSLPMPPIDRETAVGRRLELLASQLASADARGKPHTAAERWELCEARAEIDARVAVSWGLGVSDLKLMLDDFPLLDRRQPRLHGEARSTVTADLVLSWLARISGADIHPWIGRVDAARNIGAFAFTPSEYAGPEGENGQTSGGTDLLARDPAWRPPQDRSAVK